MNRGLWILAGALAGLLARGASASTVLDITGGGIDDGTINTCVAADNCGSTTAYTYQSGGNVSGTITLATSGTTGTATFDLQLTSAVQFGGGTGEQLTAGTFTAPVSIPISLSGSIWSQTGSPVYGTNSAITFSTLTASENAPQISSLSCTLGTVSVCGFFLGPTGFEMTDSGGNTYDANLGLDVTAQVVPLPSSLWLALSGLGLLWRGRRHRAVSA
ncbi:MAG TPA: hypothetical protein VME42_00115 [Steroidobacteraceae bacterium]|nr:hypothetical protein [Steroidobacteraceae bacterium]